VDRRLLLEATLRAEGCGLISRGFMFYVLSKFYKVLCFIQKPESRKHLDAGHRAPNIYNQGGG
jgi:hypothetical protein